MNKLQFIEAINKRLPVKMHPKTLAIYVGRAFNQIVYETFYKNITNLDIYTKEYRGVPVVHDDEIDVWYSKIPVSIVQLPEAGDGVVAIHSMKGKGVEFAAKKSGFSDIHRTLEVARLSGPIPYWIMSGRVEYGLKGGIDKVGTVRMRLVRQFEAYDMTEEIHIPAGKDERLMTLVTNFASGAIPDKEINDQSKKTP